VTENRDYLEIGERPWGKYFVLEDLPKYKVKKIMVLPGQRLSLQSHFHRSEHWVSVDGVVTVEIQKKGETSLQKFDMKEGENCYIPKEAKHRLSNTSEDPVWIVEVQIGDYTGEDDIVRYEDDYSRM
jgi:mannose-6-phosphate isomerase-like protein (cupin superfamily)